MYDTDTEFARKRKEDDAAIVAAFDLRTRADVIRAAKERGYAEGDFSIAALAYRDKLFCAAARHYGAEVCAGCGNLTLQPELNSYRGAPTMCDTCDRNIYEAVCGLPEWVRDRDLPDVIPALVRAFVATAREARS